MLLLVNSVQLVCYIALLAFAGRWLLGLMAGQQKETNFFYQILDVMVKPFIKGARLITPRVIIDRHVPLVAFLLLGFIGVIVFFEKVSICMKIGMEFCK